MWHSAAGACLNDRHWGGPEWGHFKTLRVLTVKCQRSDEPTCRDLSDLCTSWEEDSSGLTVTLGLAQSDVVKGLHRAQRLDLGPDVAAPGLNLCFHQKTADSVVTAWEHHEFLSFLPMYLN